MKCVMFVICKVLFGDGAMFGVYAVCVLHVKHGWNAHCKVLRY